MSGQRRPDIVIIMTDEERAAPPYESDAVTAWRRCALTGRAWFDEHAVNFGRHYTGSLACVPSRPTIFTGQYPDVHGVTQTDGLGKMADDSRLRWLPEGEVPTLGHWFRAVGYDTHYDGKWHISHADLVDDDGCVLATNDDDGNVDAAAVARYLAANPLDVHGFDGWVGPEPHGAALANAGVRRDPLTADRVVAWLDDRYARRRAGDADAQRPFLLVASFVNPHDIVLFPAWARRGDPLQPSPLEPPPIGAAPTADEDLAHKPAAQIAFREAYPSGYGFAPAVAALYGNRSQEYRDLYYRLHAEVDGPIDRVRRAVTDGGSDEAVIVRTSDHGDLLGAHGGLHQKWFNLYDEATRVPFSIARIGERATRGCVIDDAPTSHVDIVPTLLAAAGIAAADVSDLLRAEFSEVHPLPGRNLMPVVDDPALADRDRGVYLLTRDNMLEGDSGASGLARRFGRGSRPPGPLRIRVPAHVAANFEGIVQRVDGTLWKLVRTFDDPATWTEPGRRHLAATGPAGDQFRSTPLPDQWELYDLDADPIEAANRAHDESCRDVFATLQAALGAERARAVPERNHPWPYATRRPTGGPASHRPPQPARLLRRLVQRLGLHPADPDSRAFRLPGRRALIVATNHGTLDIGKPTGVFASEMTVPYYAFADAGLGVDVASPLGGVVPVDPMSLKPVIRTADDDRFLADDEFRRKVTHSLAIGDLDMTDYDVVFLAGGWGAAFDFGFSEPLADQITAANAAGKVIGGVCHGPLGLINARGTDGEPLVAGRRVSGVTDKQVRELGIGSTPHHPETELRRVGAEFESATRFRDPLANHWVVDGNLVTGQNQNAGPMVAREILEILDRRGSDPLRHWPASVRSMTMSVDPGSIEPVRPSAPPLVGRAVLHQRWDELAYFHWSYEPDIVQRLLPDGVRVDTFDGRAWVGLIPFEMRRVQLGSTPPIPYLSHFVEINVRTYVVDARGRRAVWFFSLDVPRSVIVGVARTVFSLPYCWADATHEATGVHHCYTMERRWPRRPRPTASIQFDVGDRIPGEEIEPLDHFLTARWALLTARRRVLYGAVEHAPWPLYRVDRFDVSGTLLEAGGLPAPEGPPRALYSSGVAVDLAWFERRERSGRRGSDPLRPG